MLGLRTMVRYTTSAPTFRTTPGVKGNSCAVQARTRHSYSRRFIRGSTGTVSSASAWLGFWSQRMTRLLKIIWMLWTRRARAFRPRTVVDSSYCHANLKGCTEVIISVSIFTYWSWCRLRLTPYVTGRGQLWRQRVHLQYTNIRATDIEATFHRPNRRGMFWAKTRLILRSTGADRCGLYSIYTSVDELLLTCRFNDSPFALCFPFVYIYSWPILAMGRRNTPIPLKSIRQIIFRAKAIWPMLSKNTPSIPLA